MKPSEQAPDSQHERQRVREGETASPAALCVRVWEYSGPRENLRALAWTADQKIADLIRSLIQQSQGEICEAESSVLVAQFGNCFNALSAAKLLQVRLLTLQRGAGECQIVAAAFVQGRNDEAAPLDGLPATLLVEANSAQILVSEGIYEAARAVPGFGFNSEPVRTAGSEGSPEALYELLWTDESTYSHVRKTGQPALATALAANRYEIQSELGRGAMGIVYKAVDKVIGRTVALKTISIQRNFADRDELVERLKQEAKAAGGLDHPNIITIYDVGQQEGFVYLSMQFVEGQTVAALLERGKLPPLATLLSYADQICSAVGFAHQRGVIHRDLKPANFMLTADGTIKVLDFGIAKFGDASLTQTGIVVGTPTYMAPEQVTGKKLDNRSDVFSLGTVFYELLTREKPFKGDIAEILYKLVHDDPTPASVINPSLPNAIDAIIRKAMAKDPKNRYQSCEEMREAFREQLAMLKPAASEESVPLRAADTVVLPSPTLPQRNPSSRITARPPKSRGWIGSVAVILLVAALLASWAFRVRTRTGSFPPAVERVFAAVRVKHQQAAPGHSTEQVIAEKEKTPEVQSTNPGIATIPDTPQTASEVTVAAPAVPPLVSSEQAPESATLQPITSATGNPSPTHAVQISPEFSERVVNTAASAHEAGNAASPVEASATETEEQSESVRTAASRPGKRALRRAFAKSIDKDVAVEGFSRSDIPDLLRKADAAAGAGEYAVARYEYGLVLRLDRQNSAARGGLARVLAAKAEKSR